MAPQGKVHASEKQAPSAAATALDNIPTDKLQRRREFIDYPRELKAEAQAAAQAVGAQNKRLSEVFGVEKKVLSWVKDVNTMTPDVRARALRQFAFFIKDFDLTEQLDLFNDNGQPGGVEKSKDDGSVFDKTGNRAAPKTSVAADAPKKLTGAEPPAHVPTPGIPLDEAQQKFEEANAKGKAARGAKGSPVPEGAKPAAAGGGEDGAAKAATPKPPGAPKKTAATPMPPSSPTRTAEAAAKASTRRMSRAPTKEEAKVIADRYFRDPKTQEAKLADKDDDDAPGNFQIH